MPSLGQHIDTSSWDEGIVAKKLEDAPGYGDWIPEGPPVTIKGWKIKELPKPKPKPAPERHPTVADDEELPMWTPPKGLVVARIVSIIVIVIVFPVVAIGVIALLILGLAQNWAFWH